MFSESYTEPRSAIRDAIRTFFSFLDRSVYALLGIVYQLFFSVASADIFSTGVITRFYQRVQLIIGIFVLFQLAMTVLRGIVNPDSFNDSKKGAYNLIMRICTALVMLSLIVPINIPSASNEFEKQINNNGLLFGTLYSLQHRILKNNTIGKMVMGVKEDESNFLAGEDDEGLKTSSNIFTSTIIKGFYRINLLPETDTFKYKQEEGKEPDQINENRMCQDIDDTIINEYKKVDANPGKIISYVNETCNPDDSVLRAAGITDTKGKMYVFTYMPLVSTIIGVIFVIILLGFCVDVAMRAIKLAVLRLLAPIPIISYMDPKGGKDNAFDAWVKALTSTYLDLFIRIAAVYFILYIIQEMLTKGIVTSSTGVLKVFTYIFICIGLFYFAKEAPKFIKQILGIKDDGAGIFSGVGKVLGMGAAAGGMIGSGIASARASEMADKTREAFGKAPQGASERLRNRGKHLLAGITGGVAGGITGAAAAVNAKDHRFKNTMEAMQKRNAAQLAKGNDGSTLFGRMGSTLKQFGTGDTSAAAIDRQISTNKTRIDALKAVKSRVSSEMIKADWTGAELKKGDKYLMRGANKNNNGATEDVTGRINYKDFMARKSAAEAAGKTHFDIVTRQANGSTGSYTISMEDAERYKGFLLKENENDYISTHTSDERRKALEDAGFKIDDRLMTLINNANITGTVNVDAARNSDGSLNDDAFKSENLRNVTDRDSINKGIEAYEDYNSELNRRNAISKANDRYSSKK
ncbi:MAG: hypothetical protein IKE63_02555 [Bacilli bacterium]|nr:hypothetical protein [Bacilli bacterium]